MIEKQDNVVSQENEKQIQEVLMKLRRENKTRISTHRNYELCLIKLARFLGEKSLKNATKQDIERYYDQQQQILANGTLQVQMSYVKKSYRLLFGFEKRNEYPEAVRWITLGFPTPQHELTDKDLLTSEEIQKLLDACDNARDSALVAALAETGCRVGELLWIQLADMQFTKDSIEVRLPASVSKSKKGRLIEFINSKAELQKYLDFRREPLNSNAKLFPLKYSGVHRMLRELAKKAGINKPVRAHIFRHAVATSLERSGVSQALKCDLMGWKRGSKMSELWYSHLNDDDVRKENRRRAGREVEEIEHKQLLKQPYLCSCGCETPLRNARFCCGCGKPVSPDVVKKVRTATARQNRERQMKNAALEQILKSEKRRETEIQRTIQQSQESVAQMTELMTSFSRAFSNIPMDSEMQQRFKTANDKLNKVNELVESKSGALN